MPRRPRLLVLPLLAALGCPADSDGPAVEPEPVPDAVQRAFEASCMHDGCHDATARAGGLSLDAAESQAIVGGASSQSELPLVVVGDLSGSAMAIKLLPDGQLPAGVTRPGERMPLDGVESDDVEPVNTILAWIAGHGPASGGDDASAATGTGDDSSGDEPGDGSTTGTSGGEDTDPDPTADSGSGPVVPPCSVEAVTEGVVSDPLDKGDGDGQIPTTVGTILEERCGCHTLTDRELNTKFPALLAPAGTLFLDYGDTVAQRAQLEDVMFESKNMPPGSCPAIPDDDLAVLDQWFQDGQPDGASFDPP